MSHVDPRLFNQVITKLRSFFVGKGFIEVYAQNRLSILAACEDPTTIATFDYANALWPLPQTGQMWLEDMLLKDPTLPGIFCLSTSYRLEPNPVPGRHDLIFPLFEFEQFGTFEDLIALEKELLVHLGFVSEHHEFTYAELAAKYGVDELTHEHETQMAKDYGQVVFLKEFPGDGSFWNMRRAQMGPNGQIARKCDVILHGAETFGSAERSCNREEMAHEFHTISNGQYEQKLYDLFGKERVNAELDKFLEHDFKERYGGGIGLTRLIRAMQMEKLI